MVWISVAADEGGSAGRASGGQTEGAGEEGAPL